MTGTTLFTTVSVIPSPIGENTVCLTGHRGPFQTLATPSVASRISTLAIRSEPNNSVSIRNCKDFEDLMGTLIVPNQGDKRGPSLAQIDGIQPHEQIHPREDQTIDLVINGIPVVNFKIGSNEDALAEQIKKKFVITEIDPTTIKVVTRDSISDSSVTDLVYNLHLIANHELRAVEFNLGQHTYSISVGHLPVETFRKITENKK